MRLVNSFRAALLGLLYVFHHWVTSQTLLAWPFSQPSQPPPRRA